MTPTTMVVTGASTGLGKAIAERLARSGARVIGTSRNAAADADIAPSGITMARLDVCDDASVSAFGARLCEAGCVPETVILNAGFGISGAIEATSAEDMLAQLNTNLVGAHRVVRALLPGMRARGGGKLIFIGSLAGRIALPFQGPYSASKAALSSYVDALRMELRPFRITVTLVEPGDHRTEFAARRQPPRQDTASSHYEPLQSQVLSAMSAGEAVSASAESLAEGVARIADAKHPQRRYLKMGVVERVFVVMQKVLPSAWFEAMLRGAYKIA
jgi:short-subunit dehydrogenase